MSDLDKLIRRLMTQRACLERAASLVPAAATGPALQLGWGDGSAFDHLHEILRQRDIIVFDRDAAAAGAGREHVAGDPRQTLPQAWERLRRKTVLAHLNFPMTDQPRLTAELAPMLAPLLCAGGVVVSEIPVELPGWHPVAVPDGVREGRHYLYQAS